MPPKAHHFAHHYCKEKCKQFPVFDHENRPVITQQVGPDGLRIQQTETRKGYECTVPGCDVIVVALGQRVSTGAYWVCNTGISQMGSHLKAKHGIDEATARPPNNHFVQQDTIGMLQRMAAKNPSFGNSNKCAIQDHQMYFYSHDVPFHLIGSPAYISQFSVPQRTTMLFDRNQVPTSMLATKVKATDWQLERFRGCCGRLSTDSGTTRGTRFLPIFFQPNGFNSILLAHINTDDLKDQTLSADEVNRVLMFCTRRLKEKYNITVIHWAMDNAYVMQAVQPHNAQPNLTPLQIADLEDSEFYAAKIDDPFYPGKAECLDFTVAQLPTKQRDTCHVIQLVYSDFERSQYFIGTLKPAVDALFILHTASKTNAALPEEVRNKLSYINWGSATRWWSWFKAVKQIVDEIQNVLHHNNVHTAIVAPAVRALQQLKTLSDLAESPASNIWDTVYIFSCVSGLGYDVLDNDNPLSVALRAAVDNRLDWFVSDTTMLAAYFCPLALWQDKGNVTIDTLGGDWVHDKLKLIFGDEVAAEFCTWRFYVGSVDARIQRQVLGLRTVSRNSYALFWEKQFGKLFPKLFKAVIGIIACGHTEIDCERVFSQGQGLVTKLRTRLSPMSIHSCLSLRQNWTIEAYTPANNPVMKKTSTRVSNVANVLSILNNHLVTRFSEEVFRAELETQDEAFIELNYEPLVRGATHLRYIRRAERPETRLRRQDRATKLQQHVDAANAAAQAAFDADVAARRLNHAQILAGALVVDQHHYKCRHCGKLTTEHDDKFGTRENLDKMFECSKCHLWVHADCMGFGPHMFSRFEQQEVWHCGECRPKNAVAPAQQEINVDEDAAPVGNEQDELLQFLMEE